YNDFQKKQYSPIVDILIENLKLVIECNGDVWHANPEIYKPNDIIYKYTGPTEASYIWKFDQSRIEQIESFGYKVLIIWESEYKSNRQLTEKKILDAIKNQTNKKN